MHNAIGTHRQSRRTVGFHRPIDDLGVFGLVRTVELHANHPEDLVTVPMPLDNTAQRSQDGPQGESATARGTIRLGE